MPCAWRLTCAGDREGQAPAIRACRAWVWLAWVMAPCWHRSPRGYSAGYQRVLRAEASQSAAVGPNGHAPVPRVASGEEATEPNVPGEASTGHHGDRRRDHTLQSLRLPRYRVCPSSGRATYVIGALHLSYWCKYGPYGTAVGLSGCTASRRPKALSRASKLFSSGLPRGERVR